MPGPKKDSADFRAGGGNSGRVQNGNRPGFRTDTAISNSRRHDHRDLKWWGEVGPGESLEDSHSGPWDQFAANERLFGLKTDYDENMYTTAIDKSHPQYKERMAAADRKAREIERTAPVTSHVAEERIMDFTSGDGRNGDEEEKYSGVRRQDAPPLPGRETKYTPPAMRAPSAQATVKGAPVDPAIISSQLKVTHPKKAGAAKSEEVKAPVSAAKAPASRPEQSKSEAQQKAEPVSESQMQDAKPSTTKSADAKPQEKTTTPVRSPAATGARGSTPQTGDATPNASATVERDVLNSFKTFAAAQRSNLEKVQMGKARANKEVKLTELKKFATTFKLSTPVPSDLIGIIAKDPAKQKEIQDKALRNAEDMQRAKEVAAKTKDSPAAKESQSKGTAEPSAPAASEQRPAPRPQPSHTSSHASMPNRHGGGRQSYGPAGYNGQQYSRNDRSSQQQQGRSTGNLAQRLRNVEQHKASQAPHAPSHLDARLPPTAPANSGDSSFNRRPSGAPGHPNKLNPNIQEFRPNAFAPAFNPAGHPSTASSPRSAAANNGPDMHSAAPARQLTRRKTKAIDTKSFDVIAYIKTIKAPPGRDWEENCGLRPTYDTQPTWRQLQEDIEKPESTMHLTYKQYFERNPFATNAGAAATPNPSHVLPQLAHQHQLPFHLQHGPHSMAPRPSPHMAPMQMHAPPPHAHTPHVSYANTDDHRMMHSNSAQSFASPRMTPAAVTYPPAMNSPAQVPYGQPMMQPFPPNAPHMGQYRSFSNNPQYMPQQPGHMGGPMMMQPPFVAGPQGMMVTPPQMQMYPTAQGQFVPPGSVSGPPQTMPNSNGYPSPGRPAAPPMAHQGSAQGQPAYGMSPGMSYQQPAYGSQTPGQMNATRGGYSSPAMPHYGSSPSNFQQYGPQRTGGNNFNKSFASHGQQHHLAQPSHGIPSGPQGRASEGADEAK